VVDGDRIRREHAVAAGVAPGIRRFAAGGRNGDGYDELTIIARAEQPSLF
jgi:hypothetical protein